MKRRLIAVLIVCLMLLSSVGVASFATETNATKEHHVCDGTHGEEWTQWTATDAIPTQSGKYVLMNDIVLTANGGNLTDKDITICLNGHNVTQTCTEGTARFYKASGATSITICDCTAHVDADGNYVAGTFSGSRESAFFTDGNGAAINWYDGIIMNCHRPSDGGAFVVQKASSLNIYDGLFTENTAGKRGGLAYLASDATINLHGGRFTNNEAGTQGGLIIAFGAVNILGENVLIDGNKAGTDGGAIYLTNKPATMTGGTISNNTASGNGGAFAIFTDKEDRNPTLTISGGTLTGNTAQLGGGVYLANGTLNISGTTAIIGNKASDVKNSASNVYFLKGAMELKEMAGGQIGVTLAKGNILTLANTPTEADVAVLSYDNDPKATFAIDGNNVVVNSGTPKLPLIEEPTRTPTTDNATKANNICDGTHANGWTEWNDAGSLPTEDGSYVLVTDIVLTATTELESKNIVLCLNGHTIRHEGTGAYDRVYRINGSTQVTICDCTAHVDADGHYVAGVIRESKCSAFLSDNGTVGAVLNFYDGIVEDCYRLDGMGGAFAIQGGTTLNLYDGLFRNNFSAENGGAIYNSGTVNLYGGTFWNNEAAKDGGAISTKGGFTIHTDKVLITGNLAGKDAGGIKINDGNCVMKAGEISYNVAAGIVEGGGNGGGVRLAHGETITPKFEMTGGLICNNTAASQGGGCYVGSNGNLKLMGGVIRDNTAAVNGGAVRACGACVSTIGNVTITGNKAPIGGGYYYAKGTVTITGAPVIKDNFLTDGTTPSNLHIEFQDGSSLKIKDITGGTVGVTIHNGGTNIVLSNNPSWEEIEFLSSDTNPEMFFNITSSGLTLSATSEKPVDPPATEPTEPTTPTEPSEPANTTAPADDPTNPTEPKPTTPSGSEPAGGVPTLVWVIVAVAVVLIVVVIVIAKKKKA